MGYNESGGRDRDRQGGHPVRLTPAGHTLLARARIYLHDALLFLGRSHGIELRASKSWQKDTK